MILRKYSSKCCNLCNVSSIYIFSTYVCDISVTVAKEVLLAERGGQWLLSCFGPFRDRPIIPGMEDLSPEEVRCEIYEAQKSGMVEQAVSIIIVVYFVNTKTSKEFLKDGFDIFVNI